MQNLFLLSALYKDIPMEVQFSPMLLLHILLTIYQTSQEATAATLSRDSREAQTRSTLSDPEYCFGVDALRRKRRAAAKWDDSELNKSSKIIDSSWLPTPSSDDNTATELDLSRFSDEFRSCTHWKIEEGCYEILPNGSAVVAMHSKVLNDSDYLISKDGGLNICFDNGIDDTSLKFSTAFEILSWIGLTVSIICILLHMIMFILVRALRNLPGYSLISLCVSLLVSYISMLARDAIAENTDCSHNGMIQFYFLLASFFWMNVLSYDVWRSLRMATAKLRLPSHMWARFGMYSLYAWGTPVIIFIVAIVVDTVGDVSMYYRFKFDRSSCWIEYKQALFVYFVLPLLILLFCNVTFFLWSFFLITSASMKNAENRIDLWSRFCIFLRLFVIMGLTWIFGAIAAAANNIVFWYMFVISNSCQGVLIFFSFSFGRKTRNAFRSLIKRRKISSCPTRSSFQSQHFTTTV